MYGREEIVRLPFVNTRGQDRGMTRMGIVDRQGRSEAAPRFLPERINETLRRSGVLAGLPGIHRVGKTARAPATSWGQRVRRRRTWEVVPGLDRPCFFHPNRFLNLEEKKKGRPVGKGSRGLERIGVRRFNAAYERSD